VVTRKREFEMRLESKYLPTTVHKSGLLRWASGFARAMLAVIVVLLAVPELASGQGAASASASAHVWSVPERIPQYNNRLSAPYLVADRSGTVHAFDIELSGTQEYAIFYRSWTPEEGWSAPIDVLLPQFLGLAPSLRAVILDGQNMLHMVYVSGDVQAGQVFYTNASLPDAGRAQAWASPIAIDNDTVRDGRAAVAVDGRGRLVLVYGGKRFGAGLYAVVSEDSGATWSDPSVLARPAQDGQAPGAVWLEVDGQGRVHVVWSVVNIQGLAEEIGYGRLDTTDLHFDQSATLARRSSDLDLMGWPSIISRGAELIAVYQNGFPPTRWMRRSEDGGKTWTEAAQPFPHIGGYETAYLLKDSAGNIHMVTGNRQAAPEIHGMWHSRMIGNQWLPLEPIISGPMTTTFDPCCVRAVISQGNVLLATWPQNVRQESLTGAWYSYIYLNAPAFPTAQPQLPTGSAQGADAATPELTSIPENVSASATQTVSSAPAGVSYGRASPAILIFLGASPVLLFVVVAFLKERERIQNEWRLPGGGGAAETPGADDQKVDDAATH
jgi:hypothetical protein